MSRNRSLDMQKLSSLQTKIAELEYRKNNKILSPSEYEAIDRQLALYFQEESRLKAMLGY